MTLTLLPDIERLLSTFLRAQPEVQAIVDDRVYTVLPANKIFPLLRLTRVAGAPVMSRPLHLDQALVQVDAFGGSKRLAWQLAETCRAVTAQRLVGGHAEGVVTNVAFGGLSDLPDGEFDPPKPRLLFTVTITAHP
jgi:hypothetical protein